ncbi:MAG: lamin tail domain-containing protein [Bacteroidales bacterium]|jgi:hypothetical protein|nr:lamin tail domain-containing protein [Bacteroidales bacterium]
MKKITLLLSALFFALNLSASVPTNHSVFITELADPNNDAGVRYIELYNSGATAVDFTEISGWKLVKYTNDNATISQTLMLSGSIPAGGFYIVATGTDDGDFSNVYGVSADQFDGADNDVAGSNGDDNIELYDGNGYLTDQFGVPGVDGTGTNHEFEDGRAERKSTVTEGISLWDVDEWNIDNDGGDGDGAQDAPAGFDPRSWIGVPISETAPVITDSQPASGSTYILNTPIPISATVKTADAAGLDSVVLAYGYAPDALNDTLGCTMDEDTARITMYLYKEGSAYGQSIAFGSNGEITKSSVMELIGECGVVAIPLAEAATDVTSESFTANWNASVGAHGYLLDVWTQEGEEATIYASSRFDDGVSPFPSEWTRNTQVYTTSAGFEGTSGLKLGTADIAGVVTSPAFTATDDFSVVFYGQEFNDTEQSVSLSYGTQNIEVNNLTNQWLEYSVPFTKEDGALSVSFTAKRAYLDSILIQSGGITMSYVLQGDSIKTGTLKGITGLTAGTDYIYAVSAYTMLGCESDTSNNIMVTTADIPTVLPEIMDKSIRVSASAGVIRVEAAGVQFVTIFDIMGREIESRVMNTEVSFAVKQGIYLVRVADTVTKVVVK